MAIGNAYGASSDSAIDDQTLIYIDWIDEKTLVSLKELEELLTYYIAAACLYVFDDDREFKFLYGGRPCVNLKDKDDDEELKAELEDLLLLLAKAHYPFNDEVKKPWEKIRFQDQDGC